MTEYIMHTGGLICNILLIYAALNAVCIAMIAIIDPKYFWETMVEEWKETKESWKHKKEQREWRKI